MMTKRDFIALADAIKKHNEPNSNMPPFTNAHFITLAKFCHEHGPNFNGLRWYAYVKGECGPNGGKPK